MPQGRMSHAWQAPPSEDVSSHAWQAPPREDVSCLAGSPKGGCLMPGRLPQGRMSHAWQAPPREDVSCLAGSPKGGCLMPGMLRRRMPHSKAYFLYIIHSASHSMCL